MHQPAGMNEVTHWFGLVTPTCKTYDLGPLAEFPTYTSTPGML